ncbi:MAG: S24 family peptidase [Clostridiales bacterium]|nr:S24 family peptidase [Clostridiales bacterium]
MIPVGKDIPKEAVYAVYISGNSMEPYIHDGELVYVDGSETLENGDVGIFAVDGAMYCKQIYIDRELTLHLLSANPARADASLHFPGDSGASVVCKGKVLRHRVPLDNIEDRM